MPHSHTFQFAYRPDLDVFTARWLTSHSLSTERTEYEALLQAPEAHGTPFWLLDVRRRPTTTAEAALWVTTDWLRRAAMLVLPAQLRLAFLVAPVRSEYLRADDELREIMNAAYAPNSVFTLRTFTDEGAAISWLQGKLD